MISLNLTLQGLARWPVGPLAGRKRKKDKIPF